MSLRTLTGITRAVRLKGLELIPAYTPGVLFECPICKTSGLRSLACIEINAGTPTVRCAGCTQWSDEPFNILYHLGQDDDAHDPFEIQLRVFDLICAIERAKT